MSIKGWIRELRNIYTTKYYTAMKKNEMNEWKPFHVTMVNFTSKYWAREGRKQRIHTAERLCKVQKQTKLICGVGSQDRGHLSEEGSEWRLEGLIRWAPQVLAILYFLIRVAPRWVFLYCGNLSGCALEICRLFRMYIHYNRNAYQKRTTTSVLSLSILLSTT